MLVRAARPAELQEVGRLTLEAYAHSGYIVEEDFYAAHLLDAAARAADAELYVAVLDDRLAGTVTYCPEGSPFREVAGPGEGEFRMLAVSPAARRRGVAEALVRHCLDRASTLGCEAVAISSLPVQVEAHALYTRLGFVRAPERDWAPRPGIDLLGFRLVL
ncbi:GNAT family N-acetyltransferase [Nocardioides mesophilus]|uniref:GNAT family N-acetyltransferase n=1 Tax=Nocardioides mesophilus TaxID=433659 RepID=UPI001FECE489|nr:GNAT family N-acetyltransferase [Nocardioides mesophilus]